jgi:hypothetical protein
VGRAIQRSVDRKIPVAANPVAAKAGRERADQNGLVRFSKGRNRALQQHDLSWSASSCEGPGRLRGTYSRRRTQMRRGCRKGLMLPGEEIIQDFESLAEGAVADRVHDAGLIAVGDLALGDPDAEGLVAHGDRVERELRHVVLYRQR